MEPRNRMSGSCAVVSIHRFLSLLSTDTRPKITPGVLCIIPLTRKFWGNPPVISPYGHQVAIITYRIRERGLEEGKYFQVLKWLGLKVADLNL